ncbi:MAG: hypothetical protein V1867_03390 [Candidatus Falkowbacteria bacterium]
MSKFKAEVTEEVGLIRLTKNGNSFYLLAASFSGTNVPPGILPIKEILIDLPRKSKREFVFVRGDCEDAQIIILEWIQRWPDEDAKNATEYEMIPFAFIDPPKDIRPGKKIMYSIIEGDIYLRVRNSFFCSNEAISRARKFRYVPAEAIIKHILGRITLADLGMIARGADKKELEQLRRDNKSLRRSREEAHKMVKHFQTLIENFPEIIRTQEAELKSSAFALRNMLATNEELMSDLNVYRAILGDIRRVAGEAEKPPFWRKSRFSDKLELIRRRLERAATEDEV